MAKWFPGKFLWKGVKGAGKGIGKLAGINKGSKSSVGGTAAKIQKELGAEKGVIGGDKAGLDDLRTQTESQRNAGQRMQEQGFADQTAARAQQQGLVTNLQAAVEGKGPSVAEAQLNRGMDKAVKAQQSIAASGRGNPALAARTAAANAAEISQNTAADAATLRAQEQIAARDQLGGVLNDVRGQDQGMAELGSLERRASTQQRLGLEEANANNQLENQRQILGATAQQIEQDQALKARRRGFFGKLLKTGIKAGAGAAGGGGWTGAIKGLVS